jgi:hypothetical protein
MAIISQLALGLDSDQCTKFRADCVSGNVDNVDWVELSAILVHVRYNRAFLPLPVFGWRAGRKLTSY